MLIERLQVYEKKNKALPDRIIVYRDGVSEVCFRPSIKLVDWADLYIHRVNLTLFWRRNFHRSWMLSRGSVTKSVRLHTGLNYLSSFAGVCFLDF